MVHGSSGKLEGEFASPLAALLWQFFQLQFTDRSDRKTRILKTRKNHKESIWLVVWLPFFIISYFPIYWVANHPN